MECVISAQNRSRSERLRQYDACLAPISSIYSDIQLIHFPAINAIQLKLILRRIVPYDVQRMPSSSIIIWWISFSFGQCENNAKYAVLASKYIQMERMPIHPMSCRIISKKFIPYHPACLRMRTAINIFKAMRNVYVDCDKQVPACCVSVLYAHANIGYMYLFKYIQYHYPVLWWSVSIEHCVHLTPFEKILWREKEWNAFHYVLTRIYGNMPEVFLVWRINAIGIISFFFFPFFRW